MSNRLTTTISVMANIYCQISGSKRFLLFPPSDVNNLSIAPGTSSSSIDVFSTLSPSSPNSPNDLSSTHPQEGTLTPGEILYIPPTWPHTAAPQTDQVSTAVNVFFRNLDSGRYSAGRDVYGNRDVAAYERGRLDLARIVASLDKLPADVRGFYLRRLTAELAGFID